jgi:hypothetical protein
MRRDLLINSELAAIFQMAVIPVARKVWFPIFVLL